MDLPSNQYYTNNLPLTSFQSQSSTTTPPPRQTSNGTYNSYSGESTETLNTKRSNNFIYATTQLRQEEELKREKKESLQILSMSPDTSFGCRGNFRQQMRTMLRHHFILQKRYFRSIFAFVILAPIIVLLIMLGIQRSFDYDTKLDAVFRYQNLSLDELRTSNLFVLNGETPTWDLPGLYQCVPPRAEKTKCITLLYAPNDQTTSNIMNEFVKKNSDRTGETLTLSNDSLSDLNEPSSNLGIVPTASSEFIYNYTLRNPKVAQYAVSFHYPTPTQIEYTIWYNFTTTANFSVYGDSYDNSNNFGFGMKLNNHDPITIETLKVDQYGNELLTIMRGIDEAIFAAQAGASNAKIDIKLKEFPNMLIRTTTPPKNPNNKINGDVFQNNGMILALPALLVFAIVGVLEVVTEKELGQRGWMEMMGLRVSVYWIARYISASYIAFFQALTLCSVGWIFEFPYFRNTNFMVNLIMFTLYAWAMLSLGYFLSTICNRYPFVFSLITFIYQSIAASYWAVWYEKSQKFSLGIVIGTFLPFFQFSELYSQIAAKSTDVASDLFDLSATDATPTKSFNWDSLAEYALVDGLGNKISVDDLNAFPKPYRALIILAFQIVFYAMLVWIVDQGPILLMKFRLTDSIVNDLGDDNGSEKRDSLDEMDSDLLGERDRAKDMNRRFGLRIVRLVKEFKGKFLYESKERKIAVNGLYLTIEEGQLFALLGKNGAGKTTTISMLAGLLKPTSGSAFIYGKNILTDMTLIRTSMGICPQHDILFNDLTCREHIELFSGIKGMVCTDASIKKLLAKVDLVNAKNLLTRKLSGGMKRRLSVIIASIGDPKFMVLDEPTTGMDPLNRRKVWSFLSEYKKDRIILLTTHSMEEADLLGDRIAIMSKGKIRAIGNSTHLKTKHGNGYTIQIQTDQKNIVNTQIRIARLVPLARLKDESASSLIYQIPPEALSEISSLVDWLEENPDGVISGWGIMNTTLEDVFLNVSRACDSTDDDNNRDVEIGRLMGRSPSVFSHFSISSSLFGSKHYQWPYGVPNSLTDNNEERDSIIMSRHLSTSSRSILQRKTPRSSTASFSGFSDITALQKSGSFNDNISERQSPSQKYQNRNSYSSRTLSRLSNVIPIELQQDNKENDKKISEDKGENTLSSFVSHRQFAIDERRRTDIIYYEPRNTQDFTHFNNWLPSQMRHAVSKQQILEKLAKLKESREDSIENEEINKKDEQKGHKSDVKGKKRIETTTEEFSSNIDSRTNNNITSKSLTDEQFVGRQHFSSPSSSRTSTPHHESSGISTLASQQQNSSQSLRLEREDKNSDNSEEVRLNITSEESVDFEEEISSFSSGDKTPTQFLSTNATNESLTYNDNASNHNSIIGDSNRMSFEPHAL
ncbi:3808_t:CDS:10 [Ambispora leptoticha]|uniref:3808_t:CDS:1 n=1 Tax=Ambispora leptoticha TaxID=144679 RepID=A0A9N8WIS2_9GLOM|nr:3808_t:CDS:10 [Ambispora leptoticha]